MKRFLSLSTSMCALVTLAAGQHALAQAPIAVLAPTTAGNVLRAGTEIPLKTTVALVSDKKTLRVGHRVQL